MDEQKQSFHHRHLPTFTRLSKAGFWKFMHLYFPMWIHVKTDKYKDRLHHLVIDTMYGVITVIFVAMNIGLAIWYYRYFTLPLFEVRIVNPETVTSGKPMNVAVVYQNSNRSVKDVQIDVYAPHGFFTYTRCYNTERDVLHFSIGDLDKQDIGFINIDGDIFGNINDQQTISVITSYRYYNHTYHETAHHTFGVTDSSLHTEMKFPQASLYSEPVEGEIIYDNDSDYGQKNIEFHLEPPPSFTVESLTRDETALEYNPETNIAVLPTIGPHEKGSVHIRGKFLPSPVEESSTIIQGDIQSDIAASVSSQVDVVSDNTDRYFHGISRAAARAVTPRLFASFNPGSPAVYYGDTISATLTVRNTGDVATKDIQFVGSMKGEPLSMDQASATVNDNGIIRRSRSANGKLFFPTIPELPAGQARVFTIQLPTHLVNGQQLTSSFSVTGSGYSPDVDLVIPMKSFVFETKFHSHTELSATALYYDPSGGEIGYGPYPPRAWEPTALRVLLRVKNTNNTLSDVRVRTTLPPQIEWTGFDSVTVGTDMSWNPQTRVVEWRIPSLAPQADGYGAQFEVRFTPNHLQIGKFLPLTDPITMTAQDSFTKGSISQTFPRVVLPVAVQH